MRLWRNRKERWRTVLTNTSLTLDNNKNRNVCERILRKCIPESSSYISIMWNDPRGKKKCFPSVYRRSWSWLASTFLTCPLSTQGIDICLWWMLDEWVWSNQWYTGAALMEYLSTPYNFIMNFQFGPAFPRVPVFLLYLYSKVIKNVSKLEVTWCSKLRWPRI